ncbi:MAG: DUF2075 domain-containing protein [Gammaproteobacteria bacterium]|jgi:hypothetical protein|nr:DUF2075 domain-containing protein [Gammaproteobacteria bacterium]
MSQARYGWSSDFPTFKVAEPRVVRSRLQDFLPDVDASQLRAWDESIPKLQREIAESLDSQMKAREYSAILEYQLPLEFRRPDVLLLVGSAVIVLELKGKQAPSQADLDQTAAYARDLRAYHRDCDGRPVHAVVVPTRAKGYVGERDGVHVAGPDAIDALIANFADARDGQLLSADAFLDSAAYRPLPTLVQAARELFTTGTLRDIWRARANTDPAVSKIEEIVRGAAAAKRRRLILLTGVPGAGKTLVGLRLAHAHYLDDLAIAREDGKKPTAPAVFLSGNGPLVQVLQYQMRQAGGDGKTFVRDVKGYVQAYSRRRSAIPPEHVLIFDEAQRAWDGEMVASKGHTESSLSEPEHFVHFAERIPDWCTIVGLIGTGQEIHLGEEGGLALWRKAVEGSTTPGDWEVHGPPQLESMFAGSAVPFVGSTKLSLDAEIRFHLARDVHPFVDALLRGRPDIARQHARYLAEQQFHLRMTRSLDIAKNYLRERYADHTLARYGLVASSRDKDLNRFGVRNDFNWTKNVKVGPWYVDDEGSRNSCRQLEEVVTEFAAQGLELDAALLCWGTDLLREENVWSTARARGYKKGSHVRNPHQLRLNAYRVLLTRGRDGTIIFVPPITELDETWQYLLACGVAVVSERSGSE